MSDVSQGPGWWQASDGRWYPPESHPSRTVPSPYNPPPGSPYGSYGAYGSYGSQPYGAYGSGPYGPSAPVIPRTNGMAIASLVCSIAGFVLVGIPAVVGIVLGFVSRGQIHRSEGTQTGAGLALGGIIVGFTELALGIAFVVVVVAVAVHDLPNLQIAGAPGYSTFNGPSGKPMAVGRPWGVACEPIVLHAGAQVPASDYQDLQGVVSNARLNGIDITVENRQSFWYPSTLYPSGLTNATVQFVSLFVNSGTPPLLSDGHREHIGFAWDARPSADGRHEVVTYLQATLYLQAVTTAAQADLALRQLVAFTQGVASSDALGSGIIDGSTATTFSPQDYAAMRLMSGCHPPTPS